MAPVSARRYISPRSDTTGTAAVWTRIRLSPEDEVYLSLAKEVTYSTKVIEHFFKSCPIKFPQEEHSTVNIKRKLNAP